MFGRCLNPDSRFQSSMDVAPSLHHFFLQTRRAGGNLEQELPDWLWMSSSELPLPAGFLRSYLGDFIIVIIIWFLVSDKNPLLEKQSMVSFKPPLWGDAMTSSCSSRSQTFSIVEEFNPLPICLLLWQTFERWFQHNNIRFEVLSVHQVKMIDYKIICNLFVKKYNSW